MSATLVAAIPPQPYYLSRDPLRIQVDPSSGQRVCYGTANGVVVRTLPDQVSFKFKPVETFTGAKNPISCAAVSTNGRVVVGGDSDGSVYVWTKGHGGIKMTVYKIDQMRYVRLVDVAISPCGRRVAVTGIDRYSKKLAAVIAADSGMGIGQITGHSKGITSVQFRPIKPFTIVTAGLDGKICLHDGPPFKCVKFWDAHGAAGTACARWSPTGEEIASCGYDGTIKIWPPAGEVVKKTSKLAGSPKLIGVEWEPFGRYLAVVGDDLVLRILKASDLTEIQQIKVGKSDAPKGLCWCRCGWIIIPFTAGHVSGWKVPTGEDTDVDLQKELEEAARKAELGEEEEEPAIPDKEVDAEVTIPVKQDLLVPKLQVAPQFTWYGPKGNPTAVDFDSETGLLMIGTSMGFLMFLNTPDSVPQAFQVTHLEKETTVKACLIASNCAAAVTSDGCLRFYKLKSTPIGGGDQGTVANALAMAGGESTANGAITPMNMTLCAASETQKPPLKLLFLDEAKYVALFATDGTLMVYNVARALMQSGDTTSNFEPDWQVTLLGKPLAVSATPDGTLLAVALLPGPDYPTSRVAENAPEEEDEAETQVDTSRPLVEIYEVDSGGSLEGFRFIYVTDYHDQEVTSIMLNPEGSLLASADISRKIRVIEVENRNSLACKHWNRPHSTKVTNLEWSPDGTKLASVSTNEILLWDVDDPEALPICIKDAHNGSVNFVKLLFNNVFLSAGSDGVMKVHEVEWRSQ